MTEVYLARDGGAQIERQVVIKRLLPHLIRDKKVVEGFLGEARVAAGLDHSNLVRVERITSGEGQCYYAMEYVRGVDLRRLLSVLAKQSATMSYEAATAIAIELCAALGRVHEHTLPDGRQLVHRDVAPSNVLLSTTGEVKLTDFGRHVPALPANERTIAGTVRKRLDLFDGTIGYMSPEQCLGEPVDGRSDIYSLGVILYEMTTGMRLCDPDENDFQIMERTVRGWVTPPFRHRADYPEDLQTIVMRAIERDPGRRYQSIGALQRALEALQPASASAIAELVEFAAPRPTSASELAADAALVPSLEDRPTIVVSRAHPSPRLELPKTRVQQLWRRRPWPYVALGGAMIAGVLAALLMIAGSNGAATAAPATAAPVSEAQPAPMVLPPIEVIVPRAVPNGGTAAIGASGPATPAADPAAAPGAPPPATGAPAGTLAGTTPAMAADTAAATKPPGAKLRMAKPPAATRPRAGKPATKPKPALVKPQAASRRTALVKPHDATSPFLPVRPVAD
jgi:serine/threonine protein kinase